jgi:hypothetical protein
VNPGYAPQPGQYNPLVPQNRGVNYQNRNGKVAFSIRLGR